MTAIFKNPHHETGQTILVLMSRRAPLEKLAAAAIGSL
jgi:hypothetical protein